MPRSALHGFFEEHTARFVSRGDGPPRYEDRGVLLADLSCCSKVEIYALDVNSPVITSSSIWRLAPNKYLSISAPGDGPAREHLNTIQMEVTCAYAHFLVLGISAANLLAKLSSLNLADVLWLDGTCLQGSVARIRCIVRGENQYKVPAFHLLCSRDLGVTLCEALLQAGREFSISWIGEATLDSIRTSGCQTGVRP